jgi:acetylornithine deacetylase
MRVEVMPVEGNRCNLLATFDPGPPRILFNTHIDTVPDQYGPNEDDEFIYGRGACDSHGILAAQLEAIELLRDDGISGLGILLVVAEESGHAGAIHASSRITEPEILVVGEPTENKLMIGQKGLAKADLLARCRPGHSGYAQSFMSATHQLVAVLSSLSSYNWPTDPILGRTTMNIGLLEGGDAYNKVAEHARAGLLFRTVEPYQNLQKRVDSIVGLLAGALRTDLDPEMGISIKWLGGNDPILDLGSVPGFETDVAAFNTDITYFGWRSVLVFLLGPGSILDAHTNDEKMSKTSQARGVELYRELVHRAIGSARDVQHLNHS